MKIVFQVLDVPNKEILQETRIQPTVKCLGQNILCVSIVDNSPEPAIVKDIFKSHTKNIFCKDRDFIYKYKL